MKKNNKKISQARAKRAQKNLARKKRREAETEDHVNWLDTIVHAGQEFDLDKLMTKKTTDVISGEEQTVVSDKKDTKRIIDKLVSKNVNK